jgi:hypothetical protein
MDTNSIFNAITKGKTANVNLADRKEFDSLRTGLLRRYSRWATDFSNMGDDTYTEQYVSSVFDPKIGLATFQLKPKDEMRRKPKSYVVNLL